MLWPQGKTSYIIFWAQCEVQMQGPLLEMYSKFYFYTFNDRRTLNQAWGPSEGRALWDCPSSTPMRPQSVLPLPESQWACDRGRMTQRDFWRAIIKSDTLSTWFFVDTLLEPWAAFISNLSPGHHAWRKPRMTPVERPHGETLRLHEMKRMPEQSPATMVPLQFQLQSPWGTTITCEIQWEPSSWALPEIPDREKPWTIIK